MRLSEQKGEVNEIEKKIKDLEEELKLSNKEFEKKLAERLKEEVKVNKV
jgi:hypothetical protein